MQYFKGIIYTILGFFLFTYFVPVLESYAEVNYGTFFDGVIVLFFCVIFISVTTRLFFEDFKEKRLRLDVFNLKDFVFSSLLMTFFVVFVVVQRKVLPNASFFVSIFVTYVLAFREELLIRWFLYNYIKSRKGFLFATFLSAGIFTYFHIRSFYYGGLFQIFVSGIFYALIYEHSKNIWLVTTIHFLNNFFVDNNVTNLLSDGIGLVVITYIFFKNYKISSIKFKEFTPGYIPLLLFLYSILLLSRNVSLQNLKGNYYVTYGQLFIILLFLVVLLVKKYKKIGFYLLVAFQVIALLIDYSFVIFIPILLMLFLELLDSEKEKNMLFWFFLANIVFFGIYSGRWEVLFKTENLLFSGIFLCYLFLKKYNTEKPLFYLIILCEFLFLLFSFSFSIIIPILIFIYFNTFKDKKLGILLILFSTILILSFGLYYKIPLLVLLLITLLSSSSLLKESLYIFNMIYLVLIYILMYFTEKVGLKDVRVIVSLSCYIYILFNIIEFLRFGSEKEVISQ
ncbi:hypothetical protein SU69_00770 [Thermosipho melanesiensis]|uniref:Abortive infection protein n=2 Tax=Thermosipho melanesiensis TaxID=46541 RepID=A6LJB8_THEM4|nr:CPBP family intramembrane glutamic endopeptidase [Thermosipho melanesiensis]ABR30019.1 Abortive infection protein [Thermosipho melanesiensis BI429]APT74796.1 hypothetical protein BW47_00795 [Thermosipho melanesiensis]OOC38614.1 hypothetical protein SU68_00770 [Thermosipho melanesiensis]OOC40418.1 hypothetical protein SU70_00770 [Thermosipho melanesiensis]OOC40683.1 hypothetical protein SU69_00770 [Thermosipho melanesiensis]